MLTLSAIILLTASVANANFGYRYLGDYGFTFCLAFTPAICKDGFQPMGGTMFSWAF